MTPSRAPKGESSPAETTSAEKLSRDDFFKRIETFDADRLKGVLWGLYSKGPTLVRERLLVAIDNSGRPRDKKGRGEAVSLDSQAILRGVQQFVEAAREGRYQGGRGAVSREERSGWRFTFRRHLDLAQALLVPADGPGAPDGETALEILLNLIWEMANGREYFHSPDPIEAMKVVVSDVVKAMWLSLMAREPFAVFAARATDHLLRWESHNGWTRFLHTPTARKAMSLADVLAGLLKGADAWQIVTDAYIRQLDTRAPPPLPIDSQARTKALRERAEEERGEWNSPRSHRAQRLQRWHELLMERLAGTDYEDRLTTIAQHEAFLGPCIQRMNVKVALLRGQHDAAKDILIGALRRWSGDRELLGLAKQLNIPWQQWTSHEPRGPMSTEGLDFPQLIIVGRRLNV